MNIVLIVIKNSAVLDFATPILCKIKQRHPQANVSVLYFALSRRLILRKGKFYSRLLKAAGIKQYDYCDFLAPPLNLLGGLCRRLCARPKSDGSPWFWRLRRLRSVGIFIGRVFKRLSKIFRTRLMNRVHLKEILPALAPDLVLMDNTASQQCKERPIIYRHLAKHKVRTVLLPHAPHHAEKAAFTPLNPAGEHLPDYCDFWMPFKFEETWRVMPERRSQFFYCGYPGLDSQWLEQINERLSRTCPSRNSEGERLRCLFVVRRFLKRSDSRGPSDDAFVYDYAEFIRYLKLLRDAVAASDADIEVIVKPHPSNDYQVLHNILHELGIGDWRISYEPMYALLNQIDFVVSLYSTVFFIPAMAGVPTMMLHSSTQDVVNEWDKMEALYTGFHFYLPDAGALPDRLGELVEAARQRRATGEPFTRDIEHLRQFYADGAADRAIERLAL